MPKATKSPVSFEAGLQELEGLIAEMEAGNLPLETALTTYQRGTELLQFCESRLADAEQRIRVLEGAELKPFSADKE
ncbi:exodeoxyribonuclease VII small subunit [Iodobacter ciconiae]|uniref:Exodeoxyribonuclease 7 small subunit n=1 Tax=Iodobacter ciconiae TaxID=2496266 RepID=A0A3S8ZT82_9NEIS|nr:exodeoxyribonuclease VII small subunit [Iodobacter ciconiae]AZN36698.1 exodeoxyribonuclease VII small subunit [Iodobacter ciconiae]